MQSVSVPDSLRKSVDKLTEEMCFMRMEMKAICEENHGLRAQILLSLKTLWLYLW